MDNKAFYSLTYGLFVLTARSGDFDNGCITNTAIQAASNPSKISVAVNKTNLTAEMIKRSEKFNISVLSEKADFSVFKRFGFVSGRDADKFDGYAGAKRCENGIMCVTEGANAYFSCTVEQTVDAGSHYIFIGTVDDCGILDSAPAMTYSYYFANVKPKPQETASKGRIWVCKICGYTYDEEKEKVKFEELPDDWVCPLCKHPKSDFELKN